MRNAVIFALTCLLIRGHTASVLPADAEPAKACPKCADGGTVSDAAAHEPLQSLQLPDVQLTDQNGRKLRLVSELIRGRTAVVNFVFTSCPTICPLQGATFAKLQSALDPETSRDVVLISISLDPVTDTPERLKAWGKRFGSGPNWSLMTGAKADVEKVLRGFQIPVADKTAHQPLVFVGGAGGQWTRINGLASAAQIAGVVSRFGSESRASAGGKSPVETAAPGGSSLVSPAQRYFSDVVLIDQDGKERRLYSDLLRQKVVVINSFFVACQGSCPVMLATFSRLQEHLGDRIGKDVCLISISVDPGNDTPEKLKAYATHLHADPGWYFLTGKQENVALALAKLGQSAETREQHSNLFIIGNEPTGLWKKAFGLARPEEIIELVDGVLNDGNPAASASVSVALPSGGNP